jgi:transposase
MEVVMAKHKPYTSEYKLQAVKLAQTEGIGKTATNLGVNANMLSRWKREHELGTAQARPIFTGRGNPALTEQEKENQQLQQELGIASQERSSLRGLQRTFGVDRYTISDWVKKKQMNSQA